MSIENNKIMNLADGKVLYDDLRGRIAAKHDVPSGGASGKFLKKASATDYDLEWGDAATDAQVAEAVDDWLDENVAQETGYVLDRTLLMSNAAAPADMVGDLKSAVDDLEDEVDLKVNKPVSNPNGTSGQFLKTNGNGATEWSDPLTEPVADAVEDWLDAHPEATTSVQDWSLTENKMVKGALGFVTPEMFGAVGDGTTDDTEAIQSAFDYAMEHGVGVKFNPKTYGVIPATHKTEWSGGFYCAFLIEHAIVIDLNNAVLKTLSHNIPYWSMFNVFNYFDRNGQIVIKNGKLIGDKVGGATGSYYDSTQLISLEDSKNVILDNLTIVDSKGDGIGVSGKQTGSSSTPYSFEDFYMGIFIRNCTIDGSNRNGFSLSKCRGLYIENCVIQNTTGVNPKLGVDLEPYWGKGNVFDVTFKNCIFKNNTKGSVSGYTPDGVTFDDCEGDGALYFRNCSGIRVFNSKFDSFYANGSDALIDNCNFAGVVKAQIFTTSFQGRPQFIITNSEFNQFAIGVPSADGTKYEKVVIDNCTIKSNAEPINGSINGYYNLCDRFIVQNCNTETSVSETVNAHLFVLRKVSDEIIFRDNTIRVTGTDGPYSLVGRFTDYPKTFEFVGNRIIFDEINEGVTRNARSLFYDYTPSSDSNVIIANNIVNVEGQALNTSGYSVGVFLSASAYAHIFARNNIFRKITEIDNSHTGTIEENMNNLYGDIPTAWDGNMNVFSGGSKKQILTKNNNSSFDFGWSDVVTILTQEESTHELLPYPTVYLFGEKEELTIKIASSGQYCFMFSCPSAGATLFTWYGIKFIEGATIAAGKTYKVDVLNYIATITEVTLTRPDTSPKIKEYDKCCGRSVDGIISATGWCYTEWIDFFPSQTGSLTYKDNCTNNQHTMQFEFDDGSKDYYYGPSVNIGGNSKKPVKIRISMPTSDIADSYAYNNKSGQIFFAGSNTQYYGYTNINDMSTT